VTDEPIITVRLTLRKSVAEKLRRICHNRGLTASIIIDSWIFGHDENGSPVQASPAPTIVRRTIVEQMFDQVLTGRR
jgi:hypothetical protein